MPGFALFDSINTLPKASGAEDGGVARAAAFAAARPTLLPALEHPAGKALLESILRYSPHLARLIEQQTDFFLALCRGGLPAASEETMAALARYDSRGKSRDEVMRDLRVHKNRLSLMTAVADICGLWTLEEITGALSRFADCALAACCRFLLRQAQEKGELSGLSPAEPERDCGVILLGLGKLGGRELNYSSDIDIMFLYDPGKARYTGRHTAQHCFSRMAQGLVTMMQERTAEGYVFRTDLRLRPDPSSTPPAISVPAALAYYESVGQNWERAALIKARPVAGDLPAGERFLEEVSPFIWRKYLDFAAIADIQSIKRQMTPRRDRPISLPRHNVKTGRGGIREIEFLAQIHQLIWGGRIPALRMRPTCPTLAALAEAGIIPRAQQAELAQSYHFLRRVEHRLQMIRDQQTHAVPETEADREHLAHFLGYEAREDFESELLRHLELVHRHYRESFAGEASLGDSGNLSFTGVELDPETLDTIRRMGFSQPDTVAAQIQAWHHGKRRATRTKRARELITELTPQLLRHFSATANPDQAFLRFDEFVGKLPAGVQLFSLFNAHPKLLELVATIMGSAPSLAARLAHAPELLDLVLTADFYSALSMEDALPALLKTARSSEEELALLTRHRNEQSFLIGVQFIRRQITPGEAGIALSRLAGRILHALQEIVEREFAVTYGTIPGGALSIVALGRLGAQELTFGSDLDLLFIYDAQDMQARSSGERSFTAAVYYNRLCQRLLGALTAQGRGGRLYEADTRLRPSGKDGALAVSREGFGAYFGGLAWTFEFMALTKARVITGPPALRGALHEDIRTHLLAPRDRAALARDVRAMRGKVAAEFPTANPWNVKYIRGGLMDLEFLAQYFTLLHARRHPDLPGRGSGGVFALLKEHRLLDSRESEILCGAADFLNGALAVLRLCGGGEFHAARAPEGLKILLARLLNAENFPALESRLLEVESGVGALYRNFIENQT